MNTDNKNLQDINQHPEKMRAFLVAQGAVMNAEHAQSVIVETGTGKPVLRVAFKRPRPDAPGKFDEWVGRFPMKPVQPLPGATEEIPPHPDAAKFAGYRA